MKNRESLFKYQSCICNVQRNSDVNHRGMKIIRNNENFPLLNVINGKTSTFGIMGILRHYHYWSDPKFGPGIVEMRRIPHNFHARTTISSISWDSKIKEAVNQPRYGRVNNFESSQILGCHNNWIIMNYVDDGTYE